MAPTPPGFDRYITGSNAWDWTTHCILRVKDAFGRNQSIAFVDGLGRAMASFDQDRTWGITKGACNNLCNNSIIPLEFQFEAFANAFTTYLLPWNGNKYDGFISICMTIGSPALATYSLMLTIRKRAFLRAQFADLRESVANTNRWYPGFGERLHAIQYLLEESQQVPLRPSQQQGWFASLIVAKENDQWWIHVKKKLKGTRRGRTLSLIFQLLAAIVAWLFTVISAFVAYLGNITTALQLSASSLWVWMVPVICGWIGIGTQVHWNSIDDALHITRACLNPTVDDATTATPAAEDQQPAVNYRQNNIQHGLVIADKRESGLTPHPALLSAHVDHIPGLFDLRGDEKLRGPLFNYARIFTYSQTVRTFHDALSATMQNLSEGKTVSGVPAQEGDLKCQLHGTMEQTAQYAGLHHKVIYAYSEWNEIDPFIWKGMASSSLLALFIQWGTTGAAVMIAYLTPIQGLGCRSGGYLIYGVVATLSWLLLAVSRLLSHAAMLQYQREKQKVPLGVAMGAVDKGVAVNEQDNTALYEAT